MIKITKEDIKARFEEYNKMYFDGGLPPCDCHVIRGFNGALGLYNYTIKKGKLRGQIWITPKVDWNEEDLRETVVHEMIHHYVRAIEGHKGGLFGHNWRFKRQCRRLKRDYGLDVHTFPLNTPKIGEKPLPKFVQLIYKVIAWIGI